MASGRRHEFLGHPRGLYVLFFTEMWERFSYYGMRALLMLYMLNYFRWTQEQASGVYKWYTSLVYLTPLLGGFLADRYLGNKWAIVIGASLMAAGHFAMAFSATPIFFLALVLLILGNGFFKPNMSTQVGRLYTREDPRRDAAYTIFYMGINLGAFLSPILCGALAEGTKWGYHGGFALAGIGMVLGLATYLIGLPWVNELPDEPTAPAAAPRRAELGHEPAVEPPVASPGSHPNGPSNPGPRPHGAHAMTEAEAAATPSALPWLSHPAPVLLAAIGILAAVGAPLLFWLGQLPFDSTIVLSIGGGGSALLAAWITAQVKLAVRDRVLVVILLGVFTTFFWAAFEQAGNAMNVFADKTTDRYILGDAPPPPIYPGGDEADLAAAAEGVQPTPGGGGVLQEIGNAFKNLAKLNPFPTASFQSVNPLAIFLLAPVFAWLWVWLPRRGITLSVPMKMAIGIFLQGLAFALMIWAVRAESQPSQTTLERLPQGVAVQMDQPGPAGGWRVVFRDAPDLSEASDPAMFTREPAPAELSTIVHGGRIWHDEREGVLRIRGVLSDTDRDRMLRATVSPEYLRAVRDLAQQTRGRSAAPQQPLGVVKLDEVPEGLDLRFAGFKPTDIVFDPEAQTLVTFVPLADRDYKMLLLAGADPQLRDALNDLYVASAKYKVSAMWLVWFYVLCTLGELCLSPVGLSMVSKLAPVKFQTMLMGMWLLTSFFGNYVAGLAGEKWGTVEPGAYFLTISLVLVGVSALCFLVVRRIVSMMHGVK